MAQIRVKVGPQSELARVECGQCACTSAHWRFLQTETERTEPLEEKDGDGEHLDAHDKNDHPADGVVRL